MFKPRLHRRYCWNVLTTESISFFPEIFSGSYKVQMAVKINTKVRRSTLLPTATASRSYVSLSTSL